MLSRRDLFKGFAIATLVAASPKVLWAANPINTIFNVTTYGATGAGPSHDDAPGINAAITALKANGGGTLFFPTPAVNYWVESAIDARAVSNMIMDGAPGTTIKCSTAFDGSNNITKSSVICGLNFTGTASPQGYLYRNITITKNLIIDGSNQSVSGVPPTATGGFNLCAAEFMNVDDVQIYADVIGCFGNGHVISTHDPRLLAPSIVSFVINSGGSGYVVGDIITTTAGTFFANSSAQYQVLAVSSGAITSLKLINRGIYTVIPTANSATTAVTGSGTGATIQVTAQQQVNNGCKNPVIKCNNTNVVRGILPQYAIAGSVMQIGAATNIRVDVTGTNVGGPLIDCFNCNGGTINAVCNSVSATAIGTGQSRGSLHSDFGLTNIYITGKVPSVILLGSMISSLSFFFNGATPTPGPQSCGFDIEIDGSISPDGITPGVKIQGGSITGTVGQAKNNFGHFIISNPQSDGMQLYDCSNNNFHIYCANGSAGCVKLNAQIVQAGSGCYNNSINLNSIGSSFTHNVYDDGNNLFSNQQIKLNSVASTSGASVSLLANSYVLE